MHVMLELPDNKAASLLDVLRHIDYVTVESVAESKSKKSKPKKQKRNSILEGLRNAVEQVKLHREGKIKLRPVEELIAELQSDRSRRLQKKGKTAGKKVPVAA